MVWYLHLIIIRLYIYIILIRYIYIYIYIYIYLSSKININLITIHNIDKLKISTSNMYILIYLNHNNIMKSTHICYIDSFCKYNITNKYCKQFY